MDSKEDLKLLALKATKLNKIGIVSDEDLARMIELWKNHEPDTVPKPKTKKRISVRTHFVSRKEMDIYNTKIERYRGESLMVARDKASLSRRQLAQAVGRSESTVRRWENGTQSPSVDAFKRLEKVIG